MGRDTADWPAIESSNAKHKTQETPIPTVVEQTKANGVGLAK